MIEFFKRNREWLGSGLGALFSHAAVSAQGFLKATLQNVARESVRWLLGMSVSYLIAAALAITTLALLLSAAVDGIVALGIPSWAAHLILAAVSGGLCFLFYLKGKNRSIEDESEEEGSPYPVPGLMVKIERPRVRKAAPRRVRNRPRKRTFDVHRAGDKGWEVSSSSRTYKRTIYGSKTQAVKAARKAAKAEGPSRVVVHRADGRIQDFAVYSERRGRRAAA